MRKIYSTLTALLFSTFAVAQICNPTGNLILFSNYDGGTLNINLDAPIANIKIGVVSYEGTNINISGIGASAVTGVAYAGFDSNNNHCGAPIATNITGTPGGSVNTITFYPPAGLTNINGNPNIDCAYSCSTTTNQGGCNTIDQVEFYFLNTVFPGSTLFSHKVQYGCWTGTQNVSAGGTCCLLATDIHSSKLENGLSVFPNPAANDITLSITTGLEKATVKVFNVSGQLVKTENNLSGTAVTLDISSLQSGVYFVETLNGDVFSHTRFIKE